MQRNGGEEALIQGDNLLVGHPEENIQDGQAFTLGKKSSLCFGTRVKSGVGKREGCEFVRREGRGEAR